ncbi:MAG: aldo/keto reductase [Acidimicrobiia bacterium]|nr:aldo/keto reductase [Acidimicrobiia bacterium]
MTGVPRIEFNDGHSIPQLGFGVFRIPPEDAERLVAEAIEVGYRHIDTAWGYFNEEGVGAAVRNCGLTRDELFVTTKVWNSSQGRAPAIESFDRSLETLGLEVLDLLLIHWPAPANDLYVETWETFVELRESGRVRSIGVSNFEPEHIDRIVAATGVVPVINQIELHPFFQQRALREYHAAHGIVTEAWGPIARGAVGDDPLLVTLASSWGRTPAQIALRWELQHDIVTIPKSATSERIASNFEVFDFELSADDMAMIDALDRPDGRFGPLPADVN